MATETHNGHDDHGHHIGHVVPIRVLAGVFGALLVLTVVTVAVAQVDFGSKAMNLSIAMLIATVKASLVIMYFMHIRYDRVFHGVLIAGGLLAAMLFVGFTLVDRSQYEETVIWDENKPPAVAPRLP